MKERQEIKHQQKDKQASGSSCLIEDWSIPKNEQEYRPLIGGKLYASFLWWLSSQEYIKGVFLRKHLEKNSKEA